MQNFVIFVKNHTKINHVIYRRSIIQNRDLLRLQLLKR